MHVFIITQYFPPETGASASRWSDYAEILVKQNHQVSVMCESPHYPYSRFYPGFNNPWIKIEKKSPNLKIYRTKAFASNRKTFIKKILHYFVFMFSAISNFRKVKNYDLLIISSPPLFTGVVGLFVKKFYNKKFWLDVRDLWPDSAFELGQLKKGSILKMGKKLERKIYESSEGFIFPVPSFRNYLKSFNDDIASKPMFELMNGVSEDFLKKSYASKVHSIKDFTVLYSGNMGLAQDLETIVKAAKKLENYDINFVFIGEGICKSKIELLAKPLKKKINFYDSMPRSELIKYINHSSICLVPLKNKEIFKSALPSKMFEYMACEKAVIVSIKGDAEKLIMKSNAGTVIEPENSDMLSDAILHYYNNRKKCKIHGQNGLSYVTENLSKEVLISKILNQMKSE